jgi:hypothetical protein
MMVSQSTNFGLVRTWCATGAALRQRKDGLVRAC